MAMIRVVALSLTAAVLLLGCGTGIGVGGELVAVRSDCLVLAEPGSADGVSFTVPAGFEIQFDPPAIIDSDGNIFAAEGDIIEGNGQDPDRDSAGTSCDRGQTSVSEIESFHSVTEH